MPTSPGLAPTRRLSQQELAHLLALDIPAHLATLDPAGFPRIRGRVAMEQKLRLGEKSIESISYRARLTSKAGLCGQQR